MSPNPDTSRTESAARPCGSVTHVLAAVDGFSTGRDAAVLGRLISEAASADLLLATVYAHPLLPMAPELGARALKRESERILRQARDRDAPGARVTIAGDVSVARALHRVARAEHRDLIVVGSSRDAEPGHVQMGAHTRQLLGYFDCGLAVAARDLHTRAAGGITSIGVGYDGGPEAEAALRLAATLAAGAGARLRVRAVVDDSVPFLLRSAWTGLIATEWHDVIAEEGRDLQARAAAACAQLALSAAAEVVTGSPAEAMVALTHEVDLLVIGSRRWGPAARVVLGGTGEALMRDAACSVLAVPRVDS
ncbi:MAG TPA: universal stress protein [Solirubrobacteraceae bacterium]|nr:universal stress protein [Solirubrobacteraceae bacterium]